MTTHNNEMFVATNVEAISSTEAAARAAIAALDAALGSIKITNARIRAATAVYVACLATADVTFAPSTDSRVKYPCVGKIKELFKDAELCRSDITMFAAVITDGHRRKMTAKEFEQNLKDRKGGVHSWYRALLDTQKELRGEATASATDTAPVVEPWEAVKAKAIPVAPTQKLNDGVYLAVIRVDAGYASLKIVTDDAKQIRAAVGGV